MGKTCRTLINVEAESLEVGRFGLEHLVPLYTVLVKDRDVRPPIGSWGVQSHLDIHASRGLAKECLLVGSDCGSELLRTELAGLEVKDVASAREFPKLALYYNGVEWFLAAGPGESVDWLFEEVILVAHASFVTLLVTWEEVTFIKCLGMLGSESDGAYDQLLLLEVLVFGEEQLT